eukprot:TRINITY_DN1499_c0_g1_i1.p1 TRINITY_DN1499_c0_g1~~TRINITY_DN1499_c0_g1_i1.p1  ORF type:complete len:113 (+),score=18.62 TRINITY_DN1499_c0_g1_i1:228-566(+)
MRRGGHQQYTLRNSRDRNLTSTSGTQLMWTLQLQVSSGSEIGKNPGVRTNKTTDTHQAIQKEGFRQKDVEGKKSSLSWNSEAIAKESDWFYSPCKIITEVIEGPNCALPELF